MKTRLFRIGCLAVCFAAILIIVSAYFCGLFFENKYKYFLAHQDPDGLIKIKLIQYQRGWFSSQAEISVTLNGPELLQKFSPYIVDQIIQHGPVLHHPGKLFLGSASIQNKIQRTNLIYHNNDVDVVFGNLVSQVWVSPDFNVIHGELDFLNASVNDDFDFVSFPQLVIKFDMRKKNDNWSMQDSLQCKQININDNDGNMLTLNDVSLNGFMKSAENSLQAERLLTITSMQYDDKVAGPFNVKFSLSNLNAKSIGDMVQAYQKIMERGELYQSQLSYKMSMLLPDVLNYRSKFTLDNFNLKMPEGIIRINGSISWDKDEDSFPDNLYEVINSAIVHLKLNVAKPLVGGLIDFTSSLPLFDDAKKSIQNSYLVSQQEVQTVLQFNSAEIYSMFKQGDLSEQNAMNLISLQENLVPMSFYQNEIKELFLSKQISAETSYMLHWQYAILQQPITMLRQLVDKYRQQITQNLQTQFNNLLKEGYIVEDKSDYTALIVRDQEKIEVNGRAM